MGFGADVCSPSCYTFLFHTMCVLAMCEQISVTYFTLRSKLLNVVTIRVDVCCLSLAHISQTFLNCILQLNNKMVRIIKFSVDVLLSVMSVYPHKGNKPENVFAVYLKEITQKRNNYKQTQKNTEDYIVKENALCGM